MSGPAVIIGASHAGVQLAASLRQAGWQEGITLLSQEEALPYHRPPLSKAFLSGEKPAREILLRGADFYADQGIAFEQGITVERIDPHARTVRSGSRSIPYGKLILATGARARRLDIPGANLAGIHTLRDMRDAIHLKAALAETANVVIIGGGFIGLEVAATAIKAGQSVTVLEAQDRILARALPPELSHWLTDYHGAAGVSFRFHCGVDRFEGEGGRVRSIRLNDGARLSADLVLVGIGSDAALDIGCNAGLARSAGGILVDSACRTCVDDIYAIGDCASQFNRFTGQIMRVESVQNASDQARITAAHLTGKPLEEPAVNWFWTDQYSLKIQMAGLLAPGQPIILRGDPHSGAFTLLQMNRQRLTAAFTVNRPADHMAARKLIAARADLDRNLMTDPTIPLAKAIAVSAEVG